MTPTEIKDVHMRKYSFQAARDARDTWATAADPRTRAEKSAFRSVRLPTGKTLDHGEEAALEAIAIEHLGVETLELRRNDSLDFNEVSVVGICRALAAAYLAGANSGARSAGVRIRVQHEGEPEVQPSPSEVAPPRLGQGRTRARARRAVTLGEGEPGRRIRGLLTPAK